MELWKIIKEYLLPYGGLGLDLELDCYNRSLTHFTSQYERVRRFRRFRGLSQRNMFFVSMFQQDPSNQLISRLYATPGNPYDICELDGIVSYVQMPDPSIRFTPPALHIYHLKRFGEELRFIHDEVTRMVSIPERDHRLAVEGDPYLTTRTIKRWEEVPPITPNTPDSEWNDISCVCWEFPEIPLAKINRNLPIYMYTTLFEEED